MSKSNLENYLKQIEDLEPLANLETENWDLRTRASIEATKRESKEKLDELSDKYLQTVVESGKAVFFSSGTLQEAQEYATSHGGVCVDASALYTVCAESVERSLGPSREYGGLQQVNLLNSLAYACKWVGLNSFQTLPPLGEVKYLQTFEDVFAHVKNIVRNSIGDELNVLHLKKAIRHKTLLAKVASEEPLVVFWGTNSEEEINSLSSLLGFSNVRSTAQETPKKTETKKKKQNENNTENQ